MLWKRKHAGWLQIFSTVFMVKSYDHWIINYMFMARIMKQLIIMRQEHEKYPIIESHMPVCLKAYHIIMYIIPLSHYHIYEFTHHQSQIIIQGRHGLTSFILDTQSHTSIIFSRFMPKVSSNHSEVISWKICIQPNHHQSWFLSFNKALNIHLVFQQLVEHHFR